MVSAYEDAEAVRRRVNQLYWSLEQLAERTGISSKTCSRALRGLPVSDDTRRRIDLALDLAEREVPVAVG